MEAWVRILSQPALFQPSFLQSLKLYSICRCDGCESVLRSIEKQIERANTHKEKKQKQKIQVEAEVENLKKAIKASSQSDMDNGGVSGMPASYHSQQYQQKAPTTSKTKGLRGSGKVFGTQVRR